MCAPAALRSPLSKRPHPLQPTNENSKGPGQHIRRGFIYPTNTQINSDFQYGVRVRCKVKAFIKECDSFVFRKHFSVENSKRDDGSFSSVCPSLLSLRAPHKVPRPSDLVLVGGVEGYLDDLGVSLSHLLHRTAAQLNALQECGLGRIACNGPLRTETPLLVTLKALYPGIAESQRRLRMSSHPSGGEGSWARRSTVVASDHGVTAPKLQPLPCRPPGLPPHPEPRPPPPPTPAPDPNQHEKASPTRRHHLRLEEAQDTLPTYSGLFYLPWAC